ncbi:TPA: UDP binding domain-containing protein [Streptococcus suis]
MLNFLMDYFTFAEMQNLDSKKIIEAMGYDQRIGNSHNNPSFGYGGYCLPKDTRELSASFQSNQGILINSIIKSNDIRKNFLVRQILNTSARVVGIYRLVMKMKSDNFRESAVVSIIEKLIKNGVEVLIYEPLWNMSEYKGAKLVKDINIFKDKSRIIIANRVTDELEEVLEKVYSRDIFNRD